MLSALIVFTVLGLVFGAILGFAAVQFKVQGDPMVDKIDAILPQTQCGQCGYPGCRPYATAIAKDEADINRCPPGGETAMVALADLLGKEAKPLTAEAEKAKVKTYVVIDEEVCIGCTKCLQACPVDAIIGAAKQMHTVVKDLCTGCNLCIEPCPVDCIYIRDHVTTIETWKWPLPNVIEYREAS
ncbi:MAG: electron transport complex subunit RsxB [Gammaproteobacteria bacterium]|nr:electron transport complex subunit RsxB [Gammaproteobacteria bacterium]